jgi:hypothetical protein
MVMCRCGIGLSCQQSVFDHWQRGHFDVFENEVPPKSAYSTTKSPAVSMTDDELEFVDSRPIGPAPGTLRALVERIRSGLTELEVEVNRFELSHGASNDDVAEAVDEVAAEMVLGLARLRVTVHKIANHAEHQVKESNAV